MIKITKQYYRTNINVPFHNERVNDVAPVDGTYFRTNYIDTGKMVFISNTISEDGLTMSHESLWIDRETWEAHKNDLQIIQFYALRDQYNANNGITFSDTTVEEI